MSASRDFQIFVKPAGPRCNLGCDYCYYLAKVALYPAGESFRMEEDVLENYIAQHIAAAPGDVVNFSWHGGEPMVLGLKYFRDITALQKRHRPAGKRITNAIQTNGTLIDEAWSRFFAEEGWAVGLSMDGPPELHDRHRTGRDGSPTLVRALRGYYLLMKHDVPVDILCVVHAGNVREPLPVYRFFKEIGAQHLSFLPMVDRRPDTESGVGPLTVQADDWGEFLCAVFDEWVGGDIGRIKVQIFEEAARTAFGQDHSLCIFRPTCGDIPVVEHNGDFFSCDHYVDEEHRFGNICKTPLADLLDSPAQLAFGQAKADTLPRYCRECEVLEMCHGGCPRNRFIRTPDGEEGLNWLCAGYRLFFNHCQPFVEAVAGEWRRRNAPGLSDAAKSDAAADRPTKVQTARRPGRNDPCPCGSGLKYKKCCMKS